MKKAFLAFTMLITAFTSFAQTTPVVRTREDYLQKSRHQKTAAWILLGGGAALIGTGIVITAGQVTDTDTKNTAANVVAFTGLAATLGSIPLFISAGHNKKKAASLSLNLQRVPMPFQNIRMAMVKQPVIAFKVAF